MPYNQCPPSLRGHSWRELTVADQLGLMTPIKIAPALRICKQCGTIGRVSVQGVVHVIKATSWEAP